MIPIKLDFRSGQPIYIQITDHIRQMVTTGELKVGDQLPTVRQLATELRVNFNTVARAYRMLDEAGLISTQQGRGTYIWETPSQAILDNLRQSSLEILTQRYLSEASRIGATSTQIAEAIEKYLQSWDERGFLPDFETEDEQMMRKE